MTRTVSIFLSGAILLWGVGCSRVGESPLQGRVKAGIPIPEDALTQVMVRSHVPGVSIAVIHHGAVDWAQGYGLLESGKPEHVDTHTLFQAASISKPVSAVAALRMVERRKPWMRT
jgi:CubicO group peptidase (beta-lactamase class C family)